MTDPFLSPTALTRYLGCAHATTLERELRGSAERFQVSAYEQLIRSKGDEHERRYLAELEQRVEVTTIAQEGSYDVRAARTREAMQAGVPAIFQATLVRGRWRGHADFLERVDLPTAFGPYGYEAVDTKLARNEARPSHVLQLCFYSSCIAEIQGAAPASMHLQLGSGRRESLRPRDFDAYLARAQRSLERFVDDRPETVAYPCAACAQCDYHEHCTEGWRAKDDLSFVAGIRHSQALLLERSGVPTLTALADASAITQVPTISPSTLQGLHTQAELQLRTRETGSIATRLEAQEEGRGFALLPLPSRLDMAIDLEGDPFWRADRDLTFMFGLLARAGADWDYRALWAHDEAEEALLAGSVIDAIHARLRDDPAMHVYHYGAVEVSVLKRICMLNATHEEQLDDLLRRHVLVDLVQAVRQSMRIGLESYGLKAVEQLPGFVRAADVAKGADAVLEYERWLGDGDGSHLEAIERYNDEDCRATVAVLDWLRTQAPAGSAWLAPSDGVVAETDVDLEARDLLRRELVEGAEPGSERWLAGELLAYHRRAAKPQWWAFYARGEMTRAELIADSEAIAGLRPHDTLAARVVARSLAHPLTYPEQEHKLSRGSFIDQETGAGVEVDELDEHAGVVWVKRGRTSTEPLPRAIVPGKPISMRPHADALERLATSVRDGTGMFPALERMLRNDLPVIAGREHGRPIQTTDLAELRALAWNLDRSTLVIQGPPGTGKTYTGARLITELVRQGKRVGLTALSHKAIDNLCGEIERAAHEDGLVFAGTRHGSGDHHDGALLGAANARSYPESAVVAATSWHFAKAEDHFDYLVIDEAGQFALADALACGSSADNLILLGDPSQLSQVVQGTHPPGSDASALGHVLGDDQTIPPDRGIFLDVSWRMHPGICSFISHEFYDGRLGSHACCSARTTSAGTGLRMLEVEHVGNASRSPEEAAAICDEIRRLLLETITDEHGTRPIAPGDIMVVTPYNAQARMLRSRLPDGVRVGTVDRFQGQEAPIVFFSMASSSGEDAPRDAGFLFSRNRLNVAISRAQSLAYLVCSPRLLDTRATNVEDMRLVNTLCRLAEVTGGALSLR